MAVTRIGKANSIQQPRRIVSAHGWLDALTHLCYEYGRTSLSYLICRPRLDYCLLISTQLLILTLIEAREFTRYYKHFV